MSVKKVLVSLLTLALLMGIIPQTAFADSTVYIDLSTVSTNGTGYTCSETTVNSKPEYTVTITDSGTYSLTGTINQPTDASHPTHVVVSAATANIILNGVNVSIFNFSPLSINTGSTVNLTLADGTVNTLTTATSTIALAGIFVPSGATLNIDGTGTLNAAGCYNGGAGIGGGSGNGISNAGTININSGIVNATGGYLAAGIGGGNNGTGGTVTINGGTVTAKGNYSAAGIGGGNNKAGGTVTINGGTVTANGGDGAAGIGGGRYGMGGTVIISGGTVTATGNYGAGCGGGYEGSGGTVTISGGTVTANGGYYSAGIGGGDDGGAGGNVSISGGTVTATGDTGNGARDIGGSNSGAGGANKFTGGSISATHASVNLSPTDGTNPVYETTITIPGISAATPVTYSVDSGSSISSSTDSSGKLYLWLTAAIHTVDVTAGSNNFEANGTVSGNGGSWTASIISAAALTGTATISGTAQEGQTLTVALTGGNHIGTLTYIWKSGSTTLGTGSTYIVQASDIGKTFTVEITSSIETGTITSAATAAVSAAVLTGTVAISGTAQEGQTLAAALTGGNNTGTLTYTWKSGATMLGTGSTYTVQVSDIGKTITVEITSSVETGTVTSTPTSTVSAAALTGTAAISGTAQDGQTLTATLTGGNNTGTLTYTWKSGATTLGTGSTYTVKASDIGNTITVEITSSVETGTVTSTPTSTVSPAVLTGTATISGTAQEDQMLTAALTGGNNTGTLTYIWKSGSTTLGTGLTYTVKASDIGNTITVEITSSVETGTVISAATSTISAAALTGTAAISGTAQEGQTLTAALTGGNNTGTLTYTWKSGATTLGTGSTYVVKAGDIGKTITVEITSSIETGTVTSAATSTVTRATAPVISGGGYSGPSPVTITGMQNSDGTYSASIPSYDANSSIVSSVTVNLVGRTVVIPASVLSDALGSGSSLNLSICEAPQSTQAAAQEAAEKAGRTAVAVIDINLNRTTSTGTEAVHNLSGAVTVTITLTDAQIAAVKTGSNPHIYYYDSDTGALTDMNATFDLTKGTATFTTTHFSSYLLAIADTTPPVVSGVENNGVYNTDKTITFNKGTATLDGAAFTSGGAVSAEGKHTLIVTDAAGNVTTVDFTIDKTAPVVPGIDSNGVYNTDKTITFNEGTATLDDAAFTSGGTVGTEGKHTLIVTDAAGNVTTVDFTIDKSSPVISAKAGKTVVKNGGFYSSNVTVNVSDLFNVTKAVTLNGKAIAWPLNGVFTKDGKYVVTAMDQYGHAAKMTFTIDKTAPKISVRRMKNGVTVTVIEANLSSETVTLNGKKIAWPHGNKFIQKGVYAITVTDKAGHTSIARFRI